MISAPGQKASRTVWDPVSLIDVGTTVYDYLGVDLLFRYRGVSLRPFVASGDMSERMAPSFRYGYA